MSSNPDLTRERILDVAAALVTGRPEDFTVDRIATEAEVSRATVYRRFSGVDALLAAVTDERGVDSARDRVDTGHRILEAARREFPRRGVAATTIQSIADAAGVTPMTVYNRFGDKEGVLVALLRAQGPLSVFPSIPVDEVGPEEALRRFVEGALRLARGHGDMLPLLLAPDPVTRAAFNRVRTGAGGLEERLGELLRRAGVADDVDPRKAAVSLMGMILGHGLLVPRMSGDDPGDPSEVAAGITRTLLRGVLPDGNRNSAPTEA